MSPDLHSLDLSLLPPVPRGDGDRASHFVELYEDEGALVDSVRTFVSVGIGRGEAAVVVATAAHRDAFEAELSRTVDLDAARAQGLYLSEDAEETLGLFMHDGRPDPARFEDAIGALLDRAGAAGSEVRVFGEMVAVLWAQGNDAAALELEALWNRLAEKRRFRLFCAYAAATLGDGDLGAVDAIARHHSHVVLPARSDR